MLHSMKNELSIQKWMRNKGALVDIRPESSFIQGHLPDATSLPFAELPDRLHELPTKAFALWVLADEINRQKAVVFLESKGYVVAGSSCFAALQGLHFETGTKSKRLWKANAFLEEVVLKYASSLAESFLDIGCGSGRDMVFLALAGKKVSGIDHKKQALVKAQSFSRRNGLSIQTVLQDIEQQPYNLPQSETIVVMRYLHRPLFDTIKKQISPGGHIIYQTFMQGCEIFGSPRRPCFLLKKDELATVFKGWDIIIDRIDHLADGRPVNSFFARKPL